MSTMATSGTWRAYGDQHGEVVANFGDDLTSGFGADPGARDQ
jgi:hypothetical protein